MPSHSTCKRNTACFSYTLKQAVFRLLQRVAEASPTDVRRQYRELAKLYHPDAGGDHTDFLALQQAYEQVVEYLHTRR